MLSNLPIWPYGSEFPAPLQGTSLSLLLCSDFNVQVSCVANYFFVEFLMALSVPCETVGGRPTLIVTSAILFLR